METIISKYNSLTKINSHNDAALVILKEFGTEEEISTVTDIKERTDKRGFIQLADQLDRDAIMKKYSKIIAHLKQEEKMRSVLSKLIDSLPELDNEDEPLEGTEAVDVLCGLWEEMKQSIKS